MLKTLIPIASSCISVSLRLCERPIHRANISFDRTTTPRPCSVTFKELDEGSVAKVP